MIRYVTDSIRILLHFFVIYSQNKEIFLGLPAVAGGIEKQDAS
jgi:hypothetical protein